MKNTNLLGYYTGDTPRISALLEYCGYKKVYLKESTSPYRMLPSWVEGENFAERELQRVALVESKISGYLENYAELRPPTEGATARVHYSSYDGYWFQYLLPSGEMEEHRLIPYSEVKLSEVAKREGCIFDSTLKVWIRLVEAKNVHPYFHISTPEEPFDESIQDLLATPLFPFQRVGIAKMLSQRVFLNGDMMGLGKTIQAIGAVVKGLEVNKKVLVICPAFLKFNWMAEFKKHCKKTYSIKVLTTRDYVVETQISIINYDILSKIESFEEFDYVICDEAHYLKSEKNKRVAHFSKNFLEFKGSCYFLTGTPIRNRVPELYNFMRWCGNLQMDYDAFCETFAIPRYRTYHGEEYVVYEDLKNAKYLQYLLRNWFIKRNASEVLDLPEMLRVDMATMVSKKDSKIFKELYEAYEEYSRGQITEHIQVVRQESSMAKIVDTVALATEILESGESVVIFECFVEPTRLMSKAINGSAFIDGSISVLERQAIVERFQRGEIKCLCATIGALSTGVTLTAASKMIFNSLSWVPADNMQAEKRIHRIGTSEKCLIYRMLKTEFDAKICKILSNKQSVIERALG